VYEQKVTLNGKQRFMKVLLVSVKDSYS